MDANAGWIARTLSSPVMTSWRPAITTLKPVFVMTAYSESGLRCGQPLVVSIS